MFTSLQETLITGWKAEKQNGAMGSEGFVHLHTW